MGLTRYVALLAVVLALGACSQREEVAHTHSLDPQSLLRLRFPTPELVKDIDLGIVGRDAPNVSVTPIEATQIDDTHAVLLTHVATGDDCHACAGVMGAYFYERDDKGWKLTKSHDALVVTGVKDNLGTVRISRLEGSHHVATIEWGSCWQGYCGTWLIVVNLYPNEAREMGSLATSASNDGATGACSVLDGKPPLAENDDDEPVRPEQQICYEVSGDWKFEGRRLLVDFTGRIQDVKNDELQPLRQVKQRAVYELQAKELKLVEGENPVPAI